MRVTARMSKIIEKYNLLDKDLEYTICPNKNYCITCEPLYRTGTKDDYADVRCLDLDALNRGIRIQTYWKFDQLLQELPPGLWKVEITRDGELIKRYYNVFNDFSKKLSAVTK